MAIFLNDLRHALHALLRAPVFSLAAVLTLALGIGANSAMYSMLHRILGPLPYKDQDRLTMLLREDARQIPPRVPFQGRVFLEYQEGMTQAEAMSALAPQALSLASDGEAQKVNGWRVNAPFFQAVGFQPALGRSFLPEEDREGAPATIILSHGFWKRHFGGDPGIVGRHLRLDDREVKVIGVMGASFDLFQRIGYGVPDALLPMAFTSAQREDRRARSYLVLMRLKPGATLASATQDARRVHRALMEQNPGSTDRNYLPRVAPIKEPMTAPTLAPMAALMGVAAFVLLIACANLSNLLLARGLARQRELTICAAIGAGRRALISRLMAEGAFLGFLGGTAAVLVASVLLEVLVRFVTSLNPRMGGLLTGLRVDPHLVGFTFLLAALAIAVFSLIPAWHASRVQATDVLKEGSRGSAGPGQNRLRSGLIVFEVAMAMILLAGAGLMLRSLWTLTRLDPGFNSQRLLTVQLSLPLHRLPTAQARAAFLRGLLDPVSQLPGVRSASVTGALPLGNRSSDSSYQIEGVPPPAEGYTNILTSMVVPGYFTTMGIPLLRGREPGQMDGEECVINETMARVHWTGQEPVGTRLSFNGPAGPWYTVVGVAKDVSQVNLGDPPRTLVYFASSWAVRSPTLCLRTTGAPLTVLPGLRNVLRAVDPALLVGQVRTGEELIQGNLTVPSLMGTLFTGFGLLGLLLASLGLYGLMSFVVKQRTKEIGIRMALGALMEVVVWEILKGGLQLTGLGLGLGVLAALALGRVLAHQLHGVSSADPVALAVAVLALTSMALLATLIPALRAARVDPVVALRED